MDSRFTIEIETHPDHIEVKGASNLYRLQPRHNVLGRADTVALAAKQAFALATLPEYEGQKLLVVDHISKQTTVVEGQKSHLRSDLEFYRRICDKIRKNAENNHPQPPTAA
jgi:hypothetical protein